ncbi:MAG TPA: ThuA domain-containing protein [Candidatus Scybalocola faecipullorum]|nr:ThuA domain-containing protein [Candidatus Scybalocola faecipullorum]
MIKVTVWNEFVQENDESWPERRDQMREVHPNGIHETLKAILEEDEELQVRTVTMDMPECGLTQDVLNDTDVLVWWAHVAHDRVPWEIAERVNDHVLRGMGFIALHSAHPSRPLQRLLGTSGSLKWREGDFCRVWNTCPTHPITEGIPEYFELEEEEMYGEFFDIPKPDDVVFISWFSGGEVFRSGCTWTRGYGKIFYFQPGHETNRSYYNPYVRKILKNAVHWANPTKRIEKIEFPFAEVSPEKKRMESKKNNQ